MLLCLALCHTIVVQYREETDSEEYIAQSPDELALVNAARFLGVKFLNRDEDSVISLQISKPFQ